MNLHFHESWETKLQAEFKKPYFKELTEFVQKEYERGEVYPELKAIFRALDLCPFEQTKVVILGQDPYHGPKQANGLCFSVNPGQKLPPSLKNIFKELASDLGTEPRQNSDLSDWAQQGVLLLNATLTVLPGQAGSHQKKGWEEFTDAVIKVVSDELENVVFILWGSYAQKKGRVIDEAKHLVIKSPHPSPLSSYRGFFGSKPFSKSNEYLEQHKKPSIEW